MAVGAAGDEGCGNTTDRTSDESEFPSTVSLSHTHPSALLFPCKRCSACRSPAKEASRAEQHGRGAGSSAGRWPRAPFLRASSSLCLPLLVLLRPSFPRQGASPAGRQPSCSTGARPRAGCRSPRVRVGHTGRRSLALAARELRVATMVGSSRG